MGKKKSKPFRWLSPKKTAKRSRKRAFVKLEFFTDTITMSHTDTKINFNEISGWCQDNLCGNASYQEIEVRKKDTVYSPDGTMWPSRNVLIGINHTYQFEDENAAFAFKMRWK